MDSLAPAQAARLDQLLRLLVSTTSEGERGAVAAALADQVAQAGLAAGDLAIRVVPPVQVQQPARPRPAREVPRDQLRRWAQDLRALPRGRLGERESRFASDMCDALAMGRGLSPRQAAWLADLHQRHVAEPRHA